MIVWPLHDYRNCKTRFRSKIINRNSVERIRCLIREKVKNETRMKMIQVVHRCVKFMAMGLLTKNVGNWLRFRAKKKKRKKEGRIAKRREEKCHVVSREKESLGRGKDRSTRWKRRGERTREREREREREKARKSIELSLPLRRVLSKADTSDGHTRGEDSFRTTRREDWFRQETPTSFVSWNIPAEQKKERKKKRETFYPWGTGELTRNIESYKLTSPFKRRSELQTYEISSQILNSDSN